MKFLSRYAYSQRIIFNVQELKVRNFYLEIYLKILMLCVTMIAFFSDMQASAIFQA